MSDILWGGSLKQDYTPIPNSFIDNYFSMAAVSNPVFVLVHIYIYRQGFWQKSCSTEDIAKNLGLLESDVVRAIKYWEDKGLIIRQEKPEGVKLDFVFPENMGQDSNLASGNEDKAKENKIQTEKSVTNILNYKPKAAVIIETRPNYSVEELDIYRSQSEEIKNLFCMAETVLGKLLSYNDMNMLFSFYDWLRLPVDVIEVLLLYCSEKGHKNMNYIEKAALDWSENDINTIEKADEYIKLYTIDYNQIMKAFGISGRSPSISETKYMNKWLKEYNMPIQIIFEACDKTIMQTGKAKFSYADKIIDSWQTLGVSTLDDVKRVEDQFYEDKNKEKASKTDREQKPKQTSKNRFINFKQREWDFETLEKMEREMLEASLK